MSKPRTPFKDRSENDQGDIEANGCGWIFLFLGILIILALCYASEHP